MTEVDSEATARPAHLLPVLIALAALVVGGLAGLAYLKFKSFLSDSVHERLQIVVGTSASDFGTATDLGLSLSEVASGDVILVRARSHDPLIRSIVVFDLEGRVVHSVGAAEDSIDGRTAEAFRLSREGITDPSWSLELGGEIQSGALITGAFGQTLGGVALEYPTAEMAQQSGEMRQSVTRDAIVVGIAMVALVIAIFFGVMGRGSNSTASRRVTVLLSLVLISGGAVLAFLLLRSFDEALEPELDRRAALVGEAIVDDTVRALGYGIPFEELVGVDEYFSLFLDEFPELDHLVLRDAGGEVVALTTADGSRGGGGDNARRFRIDVGSREVGSVEVGVDPGYVRSRISDLGLDVGVILLVAVVLTLELTLAVGSRFSAAARRRGGRVRRPSDARLVLLVFAVGEELNKSFLPLFTKSAENTTGLSASVAISLPIVAYLLTLAIAYPVAGRILARVGHRRLFVYGVGAAAASHLGLVFADDVLQIVGWRAVTGVGYALATVASMEYMLERLAPGDRARSIAAFVTVIMGGTFAGTAVGGILADRLGYDTVFLISFGLVLFAGFLALSLLEGDPPRSQSQGGDFAIRDILTVVKRPRLAVLLAGVTIPMNVLMAAFLWYLVPLTLDSVGSNTAAIARTLMVYYLVVLAGAQVVGRVLRYLHPWTVVGVGSVVSGAVLLLPALSTTSLTVLIAVLVVGVGHAAIRGPQVALAMDLAEADLPGGGAAAMLAAMRSLERLGSLVGLLVVAVLAAAFDLATATGAVGVAAAIAGAAFIAARPIARKEATRV